MQITGLSAVLRWPRAIFASLFRSGDGEPQLQNAPEPNSFNPDPDYHPGLEDVPRYPPFDRGLPAISIDPVLETQRDLVERLRSSGLPFVEETVRNLANYVHLLPATSNDVFSGAGGLLRLCLETGFHSYVASQGSIFTSRDPAEKRRELEPKWQLAAFLAGLCCELGRAINTSVVTNDRGQQWLPFEPLTKWLTDTDSRRYFLRPPQAQPSQQTDPAHLSGIIITNIIPPAAMQHITTEDRNILMEMLGAISRISDTFHSGHFARTIRHIRDQVIARDQRSNPRNFGTPLVGVHVEPYLINAMRHLVKQGTWKRNEKLARVHLSLDGCFVFWTTGVPEILSLLRDQGAVGIPSDPRTLGELLVQSEVFEPNGDSGLWWYIRPPGAANSYEVVKLTNPGIILEESVIADTAIYQQKIVVAPPSPGQAGAVAIATSPAGQSSPAPLAPDASSPASTQPAAAVDAAPSPQPATAAAGFSRALEVAAGGAAGEADQSASKAPAPVAATQTTESTPSESKPKKPRRDPSSPKVSAGDAQPGHPGAAEAGQDGRDVQESCKDRLSKLRPTNLNTLRTLVQWHNDPQSSRKCLWTGDGLAIPVGLIQEAGGDRQNLIIDLKAAKVLVFSAGQASSAPTAPVVHKISGGVYNMLTEEAALELGFNAMETVA